MYPGPPRDSDAKPMPLVVSIDLGAEACREERPFGPGPTNDMSPRSTFHNCGSSSRLVRRRNCPMGVSRASPFADHCVSLSSLCRNVRNLRISNLRPFCPTLG